MKRATHLDRALDAAETLRYRSSRGTSGSFLRQDPRDVRNLGG